MKIAKSIFFEIRSTSFGMFVFRFYVCTTTSEYNTIEYNIDTIHRSTCDCYQNTVHGVMRGRPVGDQPGLPMRSYVHDGLRPSPIGDSVTFALMLGKR